MRGAGLGCVGRGRGAGLTRVPTHRWRRRDTAVPQPEEPPRGFQNPMYKEELVRGRWGLCGPPRAGLGACRPLTLRPAPAARGRAGGCPELQPELLQQPGVCRDRGLRGRLTRVLAPTPRPAWPGRLCRSLALRDPCSLHTIQSPACQARCPCPIKEFPARAVRGYSARFALAPASR